MSEPTQGRVFEELARVGPADVTPTDRMRLDRIACLLQDVGFHDVIDAGVAEAGFWIVRRTTIRVEAFPRFGEEVRLRTQITGASHSLAERQTWMEGDRGGAVEARSLWVNVDPQTQMPARLAESFLEVYSPAEGSRPRSKLRHPAPPPGLAGESWTFREGDLDIVGHVNNSRYWAVADELMLADQPSLPVEIEMEHRAAGPTGDTRTLRDGSMLWIAGAGGEVYASAAITEV